MSVELDVAHTEVMTKLKAVWDASTASSVPILWHDVEGDTPDDATSWIRPTIVGGSFERRGVGQKARLYEQNSILVIQLFTTNAAGLNFKDNLVNILYSGFRGAVTSSGVRFTDMKFADLGKSGAWNQRNVTIHFKYDTAN